MNAESYSNHPTAMTRSLARKLVARKAQGQSARRSGIAVCSSIVIAAIITLGAWALRLVM